MIVFEDGIAALVEQIPNIEAFEPVFHWGDEHELNRFITLKAQPYPIIWLVTGQEQHDLRGRGRVQRDCRFIMAVREEKVNQLNDYRLRNSFDLYLNPLAERFIEGLQKFSITSLDNERYTLRKYPNYSDAGENKTIDLWDALTLNCSITMNNNCQNKIKWQNK